MSVANTPLRILPRPLGGPALVRDGRVAAAAEPWYVRRPATPDEWRHRLDAVRAAAPAGWAESLAPAIDARGVAAERLARAAGGRGAIVTTGQQPGLFGGPLYTWWKALSALALADALQEATGFPVAPVFWAATDDADFAEASETFVAVTGGLERLELAAPAASGARLADVPITGIEDLFDRLTAGAGSAVYPEALALAQRAYRDGETIGGAYVSLLRGFLEPLGIAVLDAAHPAVRASGAGLLANALRHGEAVEQALLRREADIQRAGFRAQVPLVRGRSLVFSSAGGQRERIPLAGARQAADERDETRGPNVLLRPVMERAILPTVAYVAGPGELAYFAQTSAVAETLGAEPPLAVPRWSGTVVEPHIQRLLDRHGLGLADLGSDGVAEGRVARAALPPSVHEALEGVRSSLAGAMSALVAALRDPEAPTVPAPVTAGAARDLERRIARLERRVVAAAKRENGEGMRDVATLRAALVPGGKPQERVLNLLPLLARHGPVLLTAVRAAASLHAGEIVGTTANRQATQAPAPDAGARERIR